MIDWRNNQTSYLRSSKDVNGFTANSLDSEFGIVEYDTLCFYFTLSFYFMNHMLSSPSSAVISCHHLKILFPLFALLVIPATLMTEGSQELKEQYIR